MAEFERQLRRIIDERIAGKTGAEGGLLARSMREAHAGRDGARWTSR